MTKFEQIGVNYQKQCTSVREAMERFECSCEICCCRGMYIKCDYCAIASAHNLVVATLEPAVIITGKD